MAGDDKWVGLAEGVGRGQHHGDGPRGSKDLLRARLAVELHGRQRVYDRVVPATQAAVPPFYSVLWPPQDGRDLTKRACY